MCMAPLRTLHVINNYISSLTGFVLNCFMIFVIMNVRNKELQKYSNILLQSTIFDIGLNVMNFIACPIIVISHNNVTIILNPISNLEQGARAIFFSLWVMIFHSSVFTIPISYFYRYRILCLNKTFSRKLHVSCLLILGIFAITYGVHAYYTYCIRTKNYLPTAEKLKELFGDNDGKVSATGISGTFDYYLYIALGHSSVLITGAYSIIIFCSWKIYKFMKLHKGSSHYVTEIQKQLTKTLIMQAAIPLSTFCVPILAMIIALILPIAVPEFVFALLGLTLTYIPLGNALSMLFYVKPYRIFAGNALKRGYKFVFKGQNSTIVNPFETDISSMP